MRLLSLAAGLLATLSACQMAPGTVSQDLSFVCTITSDNGGPVTQAVLAAVDPTAALAAGGAELLAAQICGKLGGTPTTSAVQAKPATRL